MLRRSRQVAPHISEMEEARETVITCHDLSYHVNVKAKCCSTQKKTILYNVSGIFKPGLNAIMGATGSGKTSLLDTLAGRKDPEGISGHVLVNGAPQPKNFKCMTGYVVQDDVVMGTLTVRENLMFSANMRLSSDVTHAQKKTLVDGTISELGLGKCADSKVGNQFIRGISGGERKRTNIGMELIVSPSLLFLDEPTSGLDSNTANAVLRLLSRISKKGRTIIFSIHQPRYSIYKLFDRLFLLVHGQTVYHGPRSEALEYFKDMGYVCEEHNNPADFFLDVLNGEPDVRMIGDTNSETGSAKREGLDNPAFNDIGKMENGHPSKEEQSPREDQYHNEQLAEKYEASKWSREVSETLEPIFSEYKKRDGEKDPEAIRGEYATSFATQMKYLSQRTIQNIARNPATTVLQVMVMLVLGFITGALYFDQDRKLPEALQNRSGLFFFAIMNMVFSNMGAIELFIKERSIFIHEHSNGFYRTSSYFFSKVVFDFVPLRVIPVLFFSVVVYFMAGLQEAVDKFFFFVLTLVFTSLTASSASFMIGASISIYAVAHILTALTYVTMMIFGGLFVNVESIWVGIRWLQYFSLFRYAFNAMQINEFKNFKFYDRNMTSGKYDIETYAGEAYLDVQNVGYGTAWDLWQNIMALGLLTLFFLTIAYIQLRRINKYR